MPTQPPLTHHEIFGLVEPFTRRGRHVDLAASNRLERRLVFKPVEHAAEAPGSAGVRETLRLDSLDAGTFRLSRVLGLIDVPGPAGAPEATLHTDGPDPGELLARIETVAWQRQFGCGPGFTIAWTHRLEPVAGAAAAVSEAAAAPPPMRLILTGGATRIEALTLRLEVPALRGSPADIELVAAAGDAIELPDDLLAVLGWNWSRLGPAGQGWRASLRLARREPARSRDAERGLERAALHLARTLAEPPGRFHDRLRRARWRVAGRRMIPLLVCIGLVGAAAAVPRLNLAQDSALRMLIFNAPPLLLVLVFCLRELPRIELPRLPRRSTAAAWRRSQPAALPGTPATPDAPEMPGTTHAG